ncbi:hypothetical protein [Dictyobacter aurantiacus]|uniref:hypothetical protein n=1 Tax=Dictyobacter aurantiacus TaxID=1936993 RepID=UPI000F8335D8|nr:hypothetical protein [Dictyobacter aurantiacus]
MLINRHTRAPSSWQMVSPVHELGVPTGQGLRRKIYETRVLVASDAHLPYLDPSLLSMLRTTIREFSIQCVLWLGDFFDCHKYNHLVPVDQRLIWKQEKQMIVDLLMLINEDLERVGGYQMISRGYHDHLWLNRHTGTEDMRSLVRNLDPTVATLMQQGRISISDSATLEGIPDVRGEMTWVFTHSLHYVSTLFQTPREFAKREQKHCIAAHAHYFDVVRDEEQAFWIVEAGGIFRDKLSRMDTHTETTWRRKQSSFWVIMEGSQPLGFCSGCEPSMVTSPCSCVRSMP